MGVLSTTGSVPDPLAPIKGDSLRRAAVVSIGCALLSIQERRSANADTPQTMRPSDTLVLLRERLKDKSRPLLDTNSILFVDNRPGYEHRYERLAADTLADLSRGSLDRLVAAVNDPDWLRPIVDFLSGRSADQVELIKDLRAGLQTGDFRDTTTIVGWLDRINQHMRFKDYGLAPLELVVTHAESHIETLLETLESMRQRGRQPAGIFLSGSPKMLTREYQSPAVQQTLELIGFALEHKIPLFGACFGHQLLAYQVFGLLPNRLTVPLLGTHEYHEQLEAISRCHPGQERTIFGSRPMDLLQPDHQLLTMVQNVLGLRVHEEALELLPSTLTGDSPTLLVRGQNRIAAIPREKVLAVSHRLFLQAHQQHLGGDDALGAAIRQMTVDVMEFGEKAFGSQLHPELRPRLLKVLLALQQYAAPLRGQRHDIALLERELDMHPRDANRPWEADHFAGACVGYNWAKWYATAHYLLRVAKELRGPMEARLRQHWGRRGH